MGDDINDTDPVAKDSEDDHSSPAPPPPAKVFRSSSIKRVQVAPAPEDVDGIHWMLDFHGWCKDRDLFTRTGETLAPIPGEERRDAAASALMESTLTRIEAGR